MKKRPYHLTNTGIRIPKRKTQWMAPLKPEVSKDEDMLPSLGNVPSGLYFHNLNLFLDLKDQPQDADVIDITDCHGGEQDDV